MSHQLKAGWPAKIVEWLHTQDEPITLKKAAAEALGLDSDKISAGEFTALSRAVFNTCWRKVSFWVPPPEPDAA